MNNVFTYVAIPTINFERAFQFYFTITNGLIRKNPNVPFPMAYFLDANNREVGHLFQLPNFKPSGDGAIVYLELGDIGNTLDVIVEAGGKVVMPKTMISPQKGYWALFLDPEGNRLALHSRQ